MSNVNIKQLLEAGVHFGHKTHRWNPKMARYIFGDRNGIYIINLEKTMLCLEDANAFIKQVAASGKEVLFVGTKKQAQDIIKQIAVQSGMPYVTERWLGGMLTNFETIRKSIARMKGITEMEGDGSFQALKKKETLSLLKERDKIKKNLEGVQDMNGVPGAVFVVDTKKEHIAVREARKLKIPVIALLDTNCDPDEVDFPIPGNDDAIRSITVICESVGSAVKEGAQAHEQGRKKAEKEEAAAEKKGSKKKKTESAEESADDKAEIAENV